MFRKVATIIGLVLVGLGVYCLYNIGSAMTTAQTKFRSEVDDLHRAVVEYHERTAVEAQSVAAMIASPYYDRLKKNRDAGHAILVRNWAKDEALWNHATVIESVAKESSDLKYASMEEQCNYIATATPAYLILDLHSANQNLQNLRGRFYFNGVRNEGEYNEVKRLFAEHQANMDQALAKANKWK